MVKQVPLGVGEQKVGVGVDFLWMLHPTFQQAGLLLQGRRLLTDWGCFGEFGWGLFNGEPSCWPALCVFWTASSVAHVSFFLLIRGRYNWTICFLPFACSQLGNCARKLLVKSCLILGVGSGISCLIRILWEFGVLVDTLNSHTVFSVIW